MFFFFLVNRPSMSGLHLVKQCRDRRRLDLQRDFTVASPAEFVTRFGGNKVIEKVIHAVWRSLLKSLLSREQNLSYLEMKARRFNSQTQSSSYSVSYQSFIPVEPFEHPDICYSHKSVYFVVLIFIRFTNTKKRQIVKWKKRWHKFQFIIDK